MSKENVGGLLGMMSYMDGERPYYLVGKRPLNSKGGDKLNKWSPGARHEHFIRNDGIGNFGFAGNGEFVESPSFLSGYELTEKYGEKRYDAELLELARQNWHSNHEAIEDVVDSLGMQEDVPFEFYSGYHPVANNCQHYVQWLTNEYDRLAR